MRVLIIGSGAREHAIAWKFSKSKRLADLFIAPGNAGTEEIGTNIENIDPDNFDEIFTVCKQNRINTVFIGPENPLANGLVDFLTERGIPTIGATKKSAKLESSKSFAKEFMGRHNIPTAGAVQFNDFNEYKNFITTSKGRTNKKYVIKKSGLAAGKGVLVTENIEEALEFGKKILVSDTLLLEEFLEGYEISVFALMDKKTYIILPTCSDFKKAYENDEGPNTGGMGSICPVPFVDTALMQTIENTIVKPVIDGMEEEDLLYRGILYFGLMITKDGPKVLEFNVRLGDPETQVLLPLIRNDFGNIADAILNEKLTDLQIEVSDKSALAVVVASSGYPGNYKKGIIVETIPKFQEDKVLVFHSSTKHNDRGQIVTGGGRCFTVVGIGKDIINAASIAYDAVKNIKFEGSWYRSDIGKKFFAD